VLSSPVARLLPVLLRTVGHLKVLVRALVLLSLLRLLNASLLFELLMRLPGLAELNGSDEGILSDLNSCLVQLYLGSLLQDE